MWSPTWRFTDAEFDRTAMSFDNADFVDVVVQSYRHRFGLAEGDPALEHIERRLAAQPAIAAPTIVLDGGADGVDPVEHPRPGQGFIGPYRSAIVPGVGHNLPQEAPRPVADAVLELL